MGLFSPIYLRVTAESNKKKKKKAFTALSRVSRPEKLYRAALKSKYGDIRSEAIKKLGELREDGYLVKLAENLTGDSQRYYGQKAVKLIRSQEIIRKIASENPDRWIRIEAIRRVTDPETLSEIASSTDDGDILGALAKNPNLREQKALTNIALCCSEWRARIHAIENPNFRDTEALAELALRGDIESEAAVKNPYLTDPSVLAKVALESKRDDARKAAVEKKDLSDQKVLANVALNDESREVRLQAAKRPEICDPELLAKIALEGKDDDVRACALTRVTDPDVLYSIAVSGNKTGDVLRWVAAEKLSHIDAERAVGPLVELMKLDRKTMFPPVYFGSETDIIDIRRSAVRFLEMMYITSKSSRIREEIASLPDGNYGNIEYSNYHGNLECENQLIEFSIPRNKGE